jgi:predicted amidohydrolase
MTSRRDFLKAAAVGPVSRRPKNRAIRIAGVSCLIRPADPEFNLAQIEKWTHLAAKESPDLVLFNETSATGYAQDVVMRTLAETLQGETVKRVTALAKKSGVFIAAGMMEKAGHRRYNSHVVVGPGGLVGVHRKSWLPDNKERDVFDPGDDANIIDIGLCKLGVAICYESVYADHCIALAGNGAEVILAPYMNGVTAQEISAGKRPYFNRRALENAVWYVACDQCNLRDGRLVPGAVCFVNPRGALAASTSLNELGEHIVTHSLDLALVGCKRL